MILDRIEPLVLSDEQVKSVLNPLDRIAEFQRGLSWLYSLVKSAEDDVGKTHSPMNWVLGGVPTPPHLHQSVIWCAFHWYAVTLHNHCRLVGKVGSLIGAAGFENDGRGYCSRVCGPVELYRNKVGAHLAFHSPRREDNRVDLERSTQVDLALANGRYWVGFVSVGSGNGPDYVQSSHDYRWSLTAVHESLHPRYTRPPESEAG